MIINAIHIYSNDVKRVELHLDRSDPTHSYVIETASGLDVSDIKSRFYTPGGALKYFDLAPPSREIALRIKLQPQWGTGETYSGLRDGMYKAMSASRTGLVQLRFMNGLTTVAAISGFPKKMEADLFTKDPSVQLWLQCDDGFLKGIAPVNQSLGGLSQTAPVIVDTVSTAPHGFKFSITYTSFRSSFNMSDPVAGWVFSLPLAMSSGDVLRFSSEVGNKYIYRIRTGVTTQLANNVVAGSVWPLIFPGTNNFTIAGSAGFNWTTLSYYETFWGV